MPLLTDLPIELFTDEILPLLPLHDLANLSQASRFFASLTADDTFWHRKLQEDFNFSGAETARKTGWQFLYKRLYNPRVYVWGYADHPSDMLGDPTNDSDGSPVREVTTDWA